ncbi:MAG: hypothetical protein KGI51_10400 [Rhodospirillales bacterium]|nr:hypothetical protein [Rhodospirillales bacterium]
MYGRYRLVDDRNVVVEGASRAAYEATLDQVERFLTDETRGRWREEQDGVVRWRVPR